MSTTRKQLGYGSQGSEVKELQTLLNNSGYKLDTDGIYGAKTQAAVKAYQKANGLAVDGITGKNTWGSLLGGKSSSTTSQTKPLGGGTSTNNPYTKVNLASYDGGYKKSDTVVGADKKATDAENAYANFGDFSYGKQNDFDAIVDKILNREKFSYDLNGDALYQQYKDKYIQQGKMAMQDTIGQASAMTGGYGNSYAATAGNQAYQASLQNLNDIVPELYQMAYDKYNQEGQDLYNQYSLLSDDRNTEYGMWGDERNALLADREYFAGRADTEYSKDYGQWSDSYNRDFNQYWNETNFGYGKERDEVSDEQWQKSFEEGQRQYNTTLAEQQRQHNETLAHNKAQAVLKANSETDTNTIKTYDEAFDYIGSVLSKHGEGTAAYRILGLWSENKLSDEQVMSLADAYGLWEEVQKLGGVISTESSNTGGGGNSNQTYTLN